MPAHHSDFSTGHGIPSTSPGNEFSLCGIIYLRDVTLAPAITSNPQFAINFHTEINEFMLTT